MRSLRLRIALNHLLVVASLALSIYFYLHIQELRRDRIADEQKTSLVDCARVNASDRRNKAQDRTLLRLVEAATGPDPSRFPIVAAKEERALERRVANKGAPNDIRPSDYVSPRHCRKLPSQRPFER